MTYVFVTFVFRLLGLRLGYLYCLFICHIVHPWSTKLYPVSCLHISPRLCATMTLPNRLIQVSSFFSKLVHVLHSSVYRVINFVQFCQSQDRCDDERCREEITKRGDKDVLKANYCDVECCSGDLCNGGTLNLLPLSFLVNSILLSLVIGLYSF